MGGIITNSPGKGRSMDQKKMVWIVGGLLALIVLLLSGAALSSYLAKGRLEGLQKTPAKDSSFRITALKHDAGWLNSTGVATVRFEHPCEASLAFDFNVEYNLHHLPLPWAPMRADLKILPNGVAAELLDEIAGGEFALTGQAAITPLGGYRADIVVPAISHRKDGEKLDVPANTWQVRYSDPAFSVAWSLAQMEYRGTGDVLTAKDIALDLDMSDYRKGLGALEMRVGQVASQNSLLEALLLKSSLSESGGSIDYVTSLSAGKIVAMEKSLKDLVAEFKLSGIDAESYYQLSRLLQDTCAIQKTTMAEAEKGREALRTILLSGPSFSMTQLKLVAEDGEFDADFEIALEKHPAKENTISFSKHLRLNGKAQISEKLVPTPQKQFIVDSGFSVAQGDKLVSSFKFGDGKLLLNDKAPKQQVGTQMMEGLAMLDKMINEMLSSKQGQQGLLDELADAAAPSDVPPVEMAPPEAAPAATVQLPEGIVNYIAEKYQDPRGTLATTVLEISQDGRDDYVVQLEGGDYCGSAGCMTLVFVSTDSGFNLAFSQNAYAVAADGVAADGAAVLNVSQHGEFCNKPGTEGCTSRMAWNGSEFTLLSKQ